MEVSNSKFELSRLQIIGSETVINNPVQEIQEVVVRKPCHPISIRPSGEDWIPIRKKRGYRVLCV
jgi:hypothetical protein